LTTTLVSAFFHLFDKSHVLLVTASLFDVLFLNTEISYIHFVNLIQARTRIGACSLRGLKPRCIAFQCKLQWTSAFS